MLSVTRMQSRLASRTLVLGMLLCLLGAGWCQASMSALSAAAIHVAEPSPTEMAGHDCCPGPQPLESVIERLAGGSDCDSCGDDWSPGRSVADSQPLADLEHWLLQSSPWPVSGQVAPRSPLLPDSFPSRPARPLFLVFGHFLE